MRFSLICAILVGASCASSSAPEESAAPAPDGRVRVVGSIMGYNQDDPRISLAVSGRDVTVSVTTYGDGCHSKGDTQVQVAGLVADVTPYDYTAPPGTPCTQPLLSSVHQATLRFASAGTARIRIHGIDARANDWRGRQVVVERVVEVR